MRILTSYYAKVPVLLEVIPDVLLVGISTGIPDFIDSTVVKHYPKLAPPVDLVVPYKKGELNRCQYEQRYVREVLDKLSPVDVFNDLINLHKQGYATTDTVVLLCYEKTGDFCHRVLVRDWFNHNGIGCVEAQFIGKELVGLDINPQSVWYTLKEGKESNKTW